ncbi:LamG-like jellyroll fold domain-containing protein, partial [Escherichia coli]
IQDTIPAPPAWSASGHLVIGRGRYNAGPINWVAGAIDDVRVYDAALTAADVAQIADSGHPLAPLGPWLIAGSKGGARVFDLSGTPAV